MRKLYSIAESGGLEEIKKLGMGNLHQAGLLLGICPPFLTGLATVLPGEPEAEAVLKEGFESMPEFRLDRLTYGMGFPNIPALVLFQNARTFFGLDLCAIWQEPPLTQHRGHCL